MNPSLETRPLAPHLRRFTAGVARLSRNLTASAERVPARLLHDDPPAPLRPCSLELGSDTGRLSCHFDLHEFPALESIAADVDEPRRVALANLWLEPLLGALRDYGVERPAVTAINAGVSAIDACLPVSLRLRDDVLVIAVRQASGDFVDALTPLAADTRLASGFSALRVPGTLRLLSRRYAVAVLNTVKPGDLLLGWDGAPASVAASPAASLRAELRWGAPPASRLGASVVVDGTQVLLQTTPSIMKNELTGIELSVTPLNAMELTLHVELATLDLTLAELAAVQAGSILELPKPLADAEVRLVSFGQRLGTGRLVAVADHLGVQVTRFVVTHE